RHQFVLGQKLLFVAQVVLVIRLVGAHQIIATGIELYPRFYRRDEDRSDDQRNLRIKEQPRTAIDRVRQPPQHASSNGISGRMHAASSGLPTLIRLRPEIRRSCEPPSRRRVPPARRSTG